MKEETAEKRQGPNAVRCYLCEYQLPTVMRFTKLQRMVGTQRDGQCEMNAQKLFPERGNKSDTYYRMDGLWGHYAEEKKKKNTSKTNIVWFPFEKEPIVTEAENRRVLVGFRGTVGNCWPME